MEELFAYIKPIIFFLILESVLLSLISDVSFKKMVKLFCGVVLVLLVLRPIAALLGLEGTAGDFLKDEGLRQELEQCEKLIQSQDDYIAQKYGEKYRSIVMENVKEIVEQEGYQLSACEVRMNEENGVEGMMLEVFEGEEETLISVRTEVEISVNTEEKKTQEEPEIIKIKNTISQIYQLKETDVTIVKAERK